MKTTLFTLLASVTFSLAAEKPNIITSSTSWQMILAMAIWDALAASETRRQTLMRLPKAAFA